MYSKNIGIIVYLKKIKDNDIYVKILSENDIIVSGIAYGGNSSKKRLIYQTGYFIDYNITLKNQNAPSSIVAELSPPYISIFFNNKFKSQSIMAIISLLNLSIIEGQKIPGLFDSIKNLFYDIKNKNNWIINFFEWLFYLLKVTGYQIAYQDNYNYKYFNLETLDFEMNMKNKNSIEFPHQVFKDDLFVNFNNIQSLFIIFENIFIKNYVDNNNMPLHFRNFKNLILKNLKKKYD